MDGFRLDDCSLPRVALLKGMLMAFWLMAYGHLKAMLTALGICNWTTRC